MAIKSSLKLMKNVFYITLKVLFFLKVFHFLIRIFGHVGKRLDNKAKINFKIYDVTYWNTNSYNKNIVRHLDK